MIQILQKSFYIVVVFLMILTYQNCGGNFQTAINGSFVGGSEDSSGEDSENLMNIKSINVTGKTHNSFSVEWSVGQNTSAYIYYGLSNSAGSTIKVNEDFQSSIHQITIEQLQPESVYFYKLGAETSDGVVYESQTFEFKTDSEPSQTEPTAPLLISEESISTIEVTSDKFVVEWGVGDNSNGYINYGLSKDLGLSQNIEDSFKFNIHRQTLSNLEPETIYYYQLISTTEAGVSYASDILSFITEKKIVPIAGKSNFVGFNEFPGVTSRSTFQQGDWSSLGSPAPPSGSAAWQRVTVPPFQHYGASGKLLLDESIKEAWASYRIQLGKNWTVAASVKLPGFSSHINEGRNSESGGNGGGWGGLCKSWSMRSAITHSNLGKMFLEVYHKDSNNYSGGAGPADHPCISNNNLATSGKYQFGQTLNTTGYVTDNNWHKVTQYVKLNDIGQSNGVLEQYLDGRLVATLENINFTNNPKYHNIAFWFIVYHGGGPDSTGTSHDIFFSDFNWNSGPIDLTF